MIKFSDETILAQCTGHLCQQFWNHCPHVQEFWIGVMILIYKQSSELLIFCVLLLNWGPTFTFKITCSKNKKKYVQRLFWNSNLVVFVFYGLSTLFMSFQARLVNLSTLFLGKPPRQPAHYFASNWQLPFLNQRKWENGFRNNFMTNLHKGMSPDVRIEPATVRIPGTRIWPSYRALLELNVAFRFVFSI